MELKKSTSDTIAYWIFCIATFGFLGILRLAITIGIREAFKSKDL
jgi:hypothetical protein